MSIRVWSGVKAFVVCVAITLVVGCGGGGGGSTPVPANPNPPTVPPITPPTTPPDPALPLMVDSLGRQLPESAFANGDSAAAGADGVAFDGGPIADSQVTLTDATGLTRTARTDSSGYYRLSIKGLTSPFMLKVDRAGGWHWYSASITAPKPRGFVTINLSGLTDKVLSYAADAGNPALSGIAANVPVSLLAAAGNTLLANAALKLHGGLGAQLLAEGLEPATFDPVSSPLQASASDKHASLLRKLTVIRNDIGFARDQGRTVVIATLAGAGGVRVDGPLAAATFSQPNGLAVDPAGNVYVADTANHGIRKIDPAGMVSTLAGNGTANSRNSADGATAAFDSPTGVAVDAAGNVYVADSRNNSIRKVTTSGSVSTLAGGSLGFADGIGTQAQFSRPTAVAVDTAGTVYVADTANGAIRKITPAGVVTTLTRQAQSAPTGVAVDKSGIVYAVYSGSAYGSHPVRKITPAGMASDLFVPTGGDGASFNPWGVAVDAAGNVYVTDRFPNRVYRITPEGAGTLLAGGKSMFDEIFDVPATFSNLRGIAIDAAGNALVADAGNSTIRKVTPSGDVVTLAGSTGLADGTGTAARFSGPTAIAIAPGGDIVVADGGNHAIRRITRAGVVTTVAGGGAAGFGDGSGANARFNAPTGVAVDASGNTYVADSRNNVIRRISAAGVVGPFAGRVGVSGYTDGPPASATFASPTHLAIGGDGSLYVSDSSNQALRKISPGGFVSTVASSGANVVNGLVIASGDFGPVTADSHGVIYFEAYCASGSSGPPRPCLYSASPGGEVRRFLSLLDGHYWGLAADIDANLHSIQDLSSYLDASAGIFSLKDAVMNTLILDPRFTGFRGFVFDANGTIVVADKVNSAIRLVIP
jgi:sugar lactone lactonase YvrE